MGYITTSSPKQSLSPNPSSTAKPFGQGKEEPSKETNSSTRWASKPQEEEGQHDQEVVLKKGPM